MSISHGKREGRGRPPIAESPLAEDVKQALVYRSQGKTWKQSAQLANMKYEKLRRWVAGNPAATDFLEQVTQENLNTSHSVLIASATKVAERLIELALDRKTKAYKSVSACEAVFRIIDKGLVDRAQAEDLKEIREMLHAIEGGRVIEMGY